MYSLTVGNTSDDDCTICVKCGYTEVRVEKGQIKTINYYGDGEWKVRIDDGSQGEVAPG